MRVLTATAASTLLLGGLVIGAQAPVPNPTNKTGVIGLMHAIHSTNDVDKTLAFYQAVFGVGAVTGMPPFVMIGAFAFFAFATTASRSRTSIFIIGAPGSWMSGCLFN